MISISNKMPGNNLLEVIRPVTQDIESVGLKMAPRRYRIGDVATIELKDGQVLCGEITHFGVNWIHLKLFNGSGICEVQRSLLKFN
jgi:hypothetical protein